MTDEYTDTEWAAIVDRAARYHLGVSGDVFLQRLESGVYDDDPDERPGVMAVLALVE